jgi:hypothetical protein
MMFFKLRFCFYFKENMSILEQNTEADILKMSATEAAILSKLIVDKLFVPAFEGNGLLPVRLVTVRP